MSGRLVDVNPDGSRTLFHYDPATGAFQIEEVQDVAPLTELAKASFNNFDERANWKGDWHHVAAIPSVVLDQLQRDGILDDPKRFRAWLNDSDNRVFRTRPGKV